MDDTFQPKPPKYGEKMWKAKIREWNCRCAKCGKQFPAEQLTRGHLLPKSVGGEKNRGNLVPLCRECNGEDGNILASYERHDFTSNVRLGPDEDVSAALSQKSHEIEEPIHGQVEYVNIPVNQRVEITADLKNGTLLCRTGYIHSVDLGTDRYWIVLDDPVALDEHDVVREADFVIVNRAAFHYLGDIQYPRFPRLISHVFEYREIPNESCTEPKPDEPEGHA